MVRIALAAFLACATVAFAEEDTRTLRGKVESVSKADKEGSVLVSISTPTGEINEYILEIRTSTKVEKVSEKVRSTVKAADIHTGQQVEAVCGRIIQPSAPPIVPTVKSILILDMDK
jgi:hypothetical protein